MAGCIRQGNPPWSKLLAILAVATSAILSAATPVAVVVAAADAVTVVVNIATTVAILTVVAYMLGASCAATAARVALQGGIALQRLARGSKWNLQEVRV